MQLWVKLSARFAKLIPRAHSQSTFGAGHSNRPLIPDPQPRAVTPQPSSAPWCSTPTPGFQTLGMPSAIHLLFTASIFTTNPALLSQIHKYPQGLTVCLWFLQLPWSVSALLAGMRMGRGTDAQGAVVSLTKPQLLSVQVGRPWLHEQENWVCSSRFVLSTFIPEQMCWACQGHGAGRARPTSALGFNTQLGWKWGTGPDLA